MDTLHLAKAAVGGTGYRSQISSPYTLNGNDSATKLSPTPNGHVPKVLDINLASGTSQKKVAEAIIEGLKLAGGCIVRNMIGKVALDEIEKDIRPHLDTASVWKGEFYPAESRRVTGCVGKSKAFALNIVGHPVFHAVGNYFLTSRLDWNWIGTQNERSTSLPQLSNTVVFSIQPGARIQVLHRDDDTHHNQQAASCMHHLGRDTGITVFVAGTRSTHANGATRFIPGSHLWDYSHPPPSDDNPSASGVVYAELEPGDAFMMLSGTYHGAGANETKDEERLIYSAAMTRGYLRQEENQYLANEVEKVRELPIGLQRFVGYGLSRPSLGWVDFGDPIGILGGKGEEGVEDMF